VKTSRGILSKIAGLFQPSRPAAKQNAFGITDQAFIDMVDAAAGREAYRWSRVDRRTQHFQPEAMSGDAAIWESHDMMNRRVRDQKINNAQVKRCVQALVDLVVGTGIQTFSSPFDPWMDLTTLDMEDLDEGLRFALEADDWFEEWFNDPDQFDACGKLSGPDMQRLALSECIQVGDAIILRCMRNEPGRVVPLCYQIIEREQLDTTKDRPSSRGQNKIVNGIEIDANGREVAFHIFDAHPYDQHSPFAGMVKSKRVRAERVQHIYLFGRPSQSLGASWLDAIGQSSFDRDKFIGSEIQTAAKNALLALIFKRMNPHTGNLGLETGEESDDDAYGNEEVKLGSSPLAVEIGTEEDVEMVESNRPTSSANNFLDILDHDIAGGAGISYYTLTGRFGKTNYTGFRGAMLTEDAHVRPLQNWFSSKHVLPIRRMFNLMAAGSGRYKTVTVRAFLRDKRRYQRFDAIGSGRQLLDPLKETDAAAGRLRTGLTTLKIECARQGLHWIKVLRQLAIERRIAEALGVPLDFSKGEGGKVGQDGQSEQDTSNEEAESDA
jgi:lambda family phage portal protein